LESSSAVIINSTITDNTCLGASWSSHGQVYVSEGELWLQGSNLARNSAPVLLRTEKHETGIIFSDSPLDYLTTRAVQGSTTRSDPVYVPAPRKPSSGAFLDGSEPWFVSTLQVRGSDGPAYTTWAAPAAG